MLESIDYKNIFKYFEEISQVPRGSYHNEKISEYLVEFAKSHGLDYRMDDARNVVIKKPASEDCKNQEPVMLQGHMDMVCVSTDGSHDFQNEPLPIRIEGDYVYSEGTTLGGDDGIALAYMLAVLDSDAYTHPPIEAVFTTDEEVGMDGARALDVSDLKAKTLINIDNEEEGILLVSCAGGASADVRWKGKKENREGSCLRVSVNGLAGGHSGTEIDKHPTNASILLGRLLAGAYQKIPFFLAAFEGGDKDNVITGAADATILCEDRTCAEELSKILTDRAAELMGELQSQEPDVTIGIRKPEQSELPCFDRTFTETVLSFLNLVITGVQVYSSDVPGMVESSLNMGVARTEETGISLAFSLRSQKRSYKDYMIEKLALLARCLASGSQKEQISYEFRIRGEYPAWDYKRDSKLRERMVEEFRNCFGREAKVEGIHAGLECGIFSEKIPGMDIVSFGPDIQNIHTVHERLSIPSAKRNFDYFIRVLERLAE